MHRTELFLILWNSAQRAREEGDRKTANVFVTNALRVMGVDLADLLSQQPAPETESTAISKQDEHTLHDRAAQSIHGGIASGTT